MPITFSNSRNVPSSYANNENSSACYAVAKPCQQSFPPIHSAAARASRTPRPIWPSITARAGHRVGVIDTDIQSPGIHVLFQLDERPIKYSLNDYLWGRCRIEEAAYDVTPRCIGNVPRTTPIGPACF